MSAKRALVVSSGMAALDVISRLLKPGDEVIAGDDLYGGNSFGLPLLMKAPTVYSNTYQHTME
jgi:cystathionine beta-lyase/cystathionine gamma-synthase